MPNAMITNVSVAYTAGAAAWRIQDAQTLAVKRTGWCSKTAFNDYEKSKIVPYRVMPNDQLVIYSVAVNETANDSENLAWVMTNRGTELFEVTTTSDNSLTEMVHATNGQTLGDLYFGSTVMSMSFQSEDRATVNSIEVIANQGGINACKWEPLVPMPVLHASILTLTWTALPYRSAKDSLSRLLLPRHEVVRWSDMT